MGLAATAPSNLDHVHMPHAQTDAAQHGSIAQDTRVVVINTQQLPMDMQGEPCWAPADIQGAVIVRKRKGSVCTSSFWWHSELLYVETSKCYKPLRQPTKTAEMRLKQRWDKIQ